MGVPEDLAEQGEALQVAIARRVQIPLLEAQLRQVAEQVGEVARMMERWRQTADAAMLASADLDRQARGLRDVVDRFFAETRARA